LENFLNIFRTTWEIDIKAIFEKGLIVYERQLQSILYNQLRVRLTIDYEIYIEPVIYQLDKIKPDMVITKDKRIISIIELKSKPWEYPEFFSDMKKLVRFKKELINNKEIVLGWIPKSVDWFEQDNHENLKLTYSIDKDLQLILAIIAKHDSDIITKELKDYANYIDIKDFKVFLGYIKKDETIEFKMK